MEEPLLPERQHPSALSSFVASLLSARPWSLKSHGCMSLRSQRRGAQCRTGAHPCRVSHGLRAAFFAGAIPCQCYPCVFIHCAHTLHADEMRRWSCDLAPGSRVDFSNSSAEAKDLLLFSTLHSVLQLSLRLAL